MDALIRSPYSQFDELEFESSLRLPEPISEIDLSEYCMALALEAFASSSSSRTASTSPASPYSPVATEPFDTSHMEANNESSPAVAFVFDEMQWEQRSFTIESFESSQTSSHQNSGQGVLTDKQEHKGFWEPIAKRRPKHDEDGEYTQADFNQARKLRSRKPSEKKDIEELPASSTPPRPTCRRAACRTRRVASKSPYQKRFACPVEDCTQSFRRCNDLKRHHQSCHQESTYAAILVCPFRGQRGCKAHTGAYARPDSLKRHLHHDHGKDEAKWRPIYEKMVREYDQQRSQEWYSL
ncbi:hypothetical protein BDZ89DRAFT_1194154 [Hymenopellis radicata]|nr:hypothetical protein BDZ89DRAFT_1194154 [Hymenopellis radicata]